MHYQPPGTIIITGASMGIGRAAALALAEKGFDLVLNARHADKLQETARACRERGANVFVQPGSAASDVVVGEMVKLANGTGTFCGVIHAAGVFHPGFYIWELDATRARDIMDASFTAALALIRAAVPHLRDQNHGFFILFGSGAADLHLEGIGLYSAAKAAEEFLGRQLAVEVPEIDVITFRPGLVETRMMKQGREAQGGGATLETRRRYREIKETGQVITPDESAAALLEVLRHTDRYSGRMVDARDALELLERRESALDTHTSDQVDIEFFKADVNGIRLHCASTGRGRLILFLHGFPEFWYCWRHQLTEFGDDHLAVAPDMRGYNLSEKPADVSDYEIDKLVGDITALAEFIGQPEFTLVGHDWGGAAAWAVAAFHPELVEKLVIINSPHPAIFARELHQNQAQQKASQYMRFLRTDQAEGVLKKDDYKFMFEAFASKGNPWPLTNDDRLLYMDAWNQPGGLTGGLNYYRASPLYPPEPGAESHLGEMVENLTPDRFGINVPTLVIWGDRDTALLPSNLDGLADYVPDLTIKRVPDAGHWIVHENPDLVNRLIRNFLG